MTRAIYLSDEEIKELLKALKPFTELNEMPESNPTLIELYYDLLPYSEISDDSIKTD